MRRYVCLVVGAAGIVASAACGSDQSTNTTVPPLTSAALALHFDTLAGELKASAPGDIRLVWYQDIASIVALGVVPTTVSAQVQGGLAVFQTATEVDAFPDSVNGKKVADSTYRLAAWSPSKRPTQFVNLLVRFLSAGTGHPDTVRSYLQFYTDTLGATYLDSALTADPQPFESRGLCVVTPLANLTVPTNPCTRLAVTWAVVGGANLFVIDPAVQVSGTHLTH